MPKRENRSAARNAPFPSGGDDHRRETLFVLVAAFLLRLAHLIEYAASPYFRTSLMDAKYHEVWAERILAGDWGSEPFFRAPLYPVWLAFWRALGGDFGWLPRLAQLGAGVATAALTHRIALRFLPPRYALVAGFLSATAWLSIHYETELLLEPLFTFFCVLSLWFGLRLAERGARPVDWVMLGLAGGLGAVTRPNLVVLLPILPLFFAPGSGWRERGARFLRRSPWYLVGVLLPILPVWVHNAACGDPATVIASQGGINLYLGNNPDANGWSAVAPGMRTDWQGGYDDQIRLANERAGKGRRLRPSEVSDYWTGEALRFWRERPGAALGLFQAKLRYFWSRWEIKNNEDIRFFKRSFRTLRFDPVSFGLLVPWGLVGLVLAWRARGVAGGSASARGLVVFVAGYTASILLFFVCSRYRLPVVPLLCVTASWTLWEIVTATRERRWLRAGLLALAVAALYPLTNVEPAGLSRGGLYQGYSYLGDILSAQSRWTEAAAAYRGALRENPSHMNSWNNLGLALERQSRFTEASAAYRRGLHAAPDHPLLTMNLAIALKSGGQPDSAAAVLRAHLDRHPEDADLEILLGDARGEQGRWRDAFRSYRRALVRRADRPALWTRAIQAASAARDTVAADSLRGIARQRFPGRPEFSAPSKP